MSIDTLTITYEKSKFLYSILSENTFIMIMLQVTPLLLIGMQQSDEEKKAREYVRTIICIDAIVFTHGHIDHFWCPFCTKDGVCRCG
jgi:hypothetical protein